MNIRYRRLHFFTLSHPLLGSGLINYLRLIFKNGLRIDPRLSLKFLLSFFVVLIWTPLRLFEDALISRKVKKTRVKPPLIILGHPRSGTTYLHYLLAADPALAYSSTYQVFMPRIFYFFGNYIGKMMDPMMPKTRAMDNLSMGAYKPTMDEFALANLSDASLCNGFYFPKNIRYYFDKYVTFKTGGDKEKTRYKKQQLYFIQKMQLRYPGKRLIIKGPATTARVKELLEIFPDAGFIHLYRNPYDTYLSNERLYEKILPLFGFHMVNNEFIEQFIVDSYRDYHQKWFAEKSLIPKGKLVEFSFEEFSAKPIKLMRDAYHQLGMELSEEALQAIEKVTAEHREYRQNKYEDLAPGIRQQLQQQWAFCFEAWGYPI